MTKEFIAEFLDWIAQNCEIRKGGDPWAGDIWQNWFYYQDEQMIGWQLLDKYIEINDKEMTKQVKK